MINYIKYVLIILADLEQVCRKKFKETLLYIF